MTGATKAVKKALEGISHTGGRRPEDDGIKKAWSNCNSIQMLNPLTPGAPQKAIHTQTNLKPNYARPLKYASPLRGASKAKGIKRIPISIYSVKGSQYLLKS